MTMVEQFKATAQQNDGNKMEASSIRKREYWYDPLAGVQREIWQPGDPDGRIGDDAINNAQPVENRWRLYQGTDDCWLRPPKHVILSDRAAYQILQSNIPTLDRSRNWDHDFVRTGRLRRHRHHRGMAAIVNPDAKGLNKYGYTITGYKNNKYSFCGQRHYRDEEAKPENGVADGLVQQSSEAMRRQNEADEKENNIEVEQKHPELEA